jgi:hypothetical protein
LIASTALRLAHISIRQSVAIAAQVIAITDNSDCGHRLVADGPSKIRAAFFRAGFINQLLGDEEGVPRSG